ncbi:MAG: endolytic transglycosylase MltG [Desulfobacteraceae bacterium]|nr:endolytic transglycosylase MltG [Desulfobacteraceae bacterium]
MSRFRRAALAGLGFLLFLFYLSTAAAMLGALHFWLFQRTPGMPAFETRQFFIQPKTSAYGVARLLESQGVVRDAREFYVLAWLGKSLQRMQAGEYLFSTMATPAQVLEQLVSGRVVIHTATLPEGSTIWDVARILEQKDLASKTEFLEVVSNREFIRSLGLKSKTLEGFLFPETYHFKKPVSGALIAKAMVQQFRSHLPQDWETRLKEVGRPLDDVIILASMIEKEAVIDSERPIIAGVFYNRLRINMPLQSDPTAVYDIPNFSGPVTAAHLTRQSPYNTYQIKGLPPGPICNPGARSISAALNPQKVPYIYFVSNNDGSHQFSVTAEEHRKAVSRYYDLKRKAAASGEAQSGPAGQTAAEGNPRAAPEETSPPPAPEVTGADTESKPAAQPENGSRNGAREIKH